jgi:hypothetical protein
LALPTNQPFLLLILTPEFYRSHSTANRYKVFSVTGGCPPHQASLPSLNLLVRQRGKGEKNLAIFGKP